MERVLSLKIQTQTVPVDVEALSGSLLLASADIHRYTHRGRSSFFRAFFLCVGVFLLVPITSCSSSPSPSKPKIRPQDVQYLNREEAVLDEVESHPTHFTVPLVKEAEIWKRARLLGKQYLNTETSQKVLTSFSSEGFHIRHFPSKHMQQNPFAYEVSVQKGESHYLVRVSTVNTRTGLQNRDTVLLAKNIARFLRTGILERSLLK